VLRDVELALDASVPTKTHILDLLHRLIGSNPDRSPKDLSTKRFGFGNCAESKRRSLCHPQTGRGEAQLRHDPAKASIVIMLRSLKLHGLAHAVDDLVAKGAPAPEAATLLVS